MVFNFAHLRRAKSPNGSEVGEIFTYSTAILKTTTRILTAENQPLCDGLFKVKNLVPAALRDLC